MGFVLWDFWGFFLVSLVPFDASTILTCNLAVITQYIIIITMEIREKAKGNFLSEARKEGP